MTLAVMLGLAVVAVKVSGLPSTGEGGWGVDACLSCHVRVGDVPKYLQLLQTSGVRWLRERDIGGFEKRPRDNPPAFWKERLAIWGKEKAAGFQVLAFASLLRRNPGESSDGLLPTDLLAVYRQSRDLARLAGRSVGAWEMCGEPETYYAKDLPDRLVAYQKAVYLGLKSVERNAKEQRTGGMTLSRDRPSRPPAVLMGALAYPPGPWLQTAAENGIYDYTDAVNFHHYGFAESLPDVIRAQRAFASRWSPGRELPLWLTEVGFNNVPYHDRENSAARQAQADYLVTCAQAAMAGRLAVFMPFILVHRDDPFALTKSPRNVRPAWTAYRDFTRKASLPPGPISSPPVAPNPVVLQWLPDENTGGTPSKLSRSYRFERLPDGAWRPLDGRIQIYNLGATPACIRLTAKVGPDLDWSWRGNFTSKVMTLPPFSLRSLPVKFWPRGKSYLRESVRFEAQALSTGKAGARSPLSFALETPPTVELPHQSMPLRFDASAPGVSGSTKFAYVSGAAPFEVTDKRHAWLGINGVKILSVRGGEIEFDATDRNVDPLSPPMAIANLPEGLPDVPNGFLHVFATDGAGQPASLRVDLVDEGGQRFSIVENLGRNARDTGASVLLAYDDFHPWVFGRCVPGQDRLAPGRIREIQLRFFNAGEGKRYRVKLEAFGFDRVSANSSDQ